MKSIAIGTAGLILVFHGAVAAGASSFPEDLTVKTVPNQSVMQTTGDPFLIVEKGQPGVNQNSSFQSSAESSGSLSDSTGVPVPRAGWISFIGVLGVIALRQHSLSRRRYARDALN